MFPNDDLKKDIQSWRFVPLSNEAAWMNNFKTKEELLDYVKSYELEIDFNEVLIPVHYDGIGNNPEVDLEKFFQDQDSNIDFRIKIFHLHNDPDFFNPLEAPEIMNILEFITYEYPVTCEEAFEVLID